MQFTNQCAGDLGIRAGDRIVAILFRRVDDVGLYQWAVFDIVRGGYPVTCQFEADALNAMLEIATREESTVS